MADDLHQQQNDDTVYLKVTISRDVSRRFKVYVANKHPDSLRGPLSEEVEKALVQYLDSKQNDLQNTHAHKQQQQQQIIQNEKEEHIKIKNNTKYQRLIDTIKRYSNEQRQISPGLVKKAIREIVGKDERTIAKYLKILQEDDILYGDSLGGKYDVQSWVFGDYNKLAEKKRRPTKTSNNNNNSKFLV